MMVRKGVRKKVHMLLGVLCGCSLLLTTQVWSQQTGQSGQDPVAGQGSVSPQPAPGSPTSPIPGVSGVLVSTATLLGSDVKNPQGEDIGDLQHLMIDPQTGRVIYAVISMGSILGMGGKTVQVPWEALGVAHNGTTFVLNTPQALIPPAADENKGEATAAERSR